jgi:predicted AAA+ superfamily ATPase
LLAEQFVLQNLHQYQLFYRTSWTNAEVDFVTQFDDKIVPIEVKSWKNIQAKSLKTYREKYQPELSFRFSLKKYIKQDWLINIPLYLIFRFREEVIED